MPLFPIFLKLTGRPCIVIGAGNLAESKIESLRAANARVTVVAPAASARIVEMAEAGEIVWHRREYAAGDLAGQFLAVAATDNPAVNRAVFAEAEAAGVLINAVDDPPFCDFYFPSVVRRGDLQIAISTAGASPALAQRLRKEINAILPLDTGDWLVELGNLRREVLQLEPLNEARRELLHQLAGREVCGYDGCPSRSMARRHALTNPVVESGGSKPTHREETAMNGAPGDPVVESGGSRPTHREETAMNGAPGDPVVESGGSKPTHREETAMNGAPGDPVVESGGSRPTHREETAMNGAPGGPVVESGGSKPTHREETAMNGAPGDPVVESGGSRPTHREETAMNGAPGEESGESAT